MWADFNFYKLKAHYFHFNFVMRKCFLNMFYKLRKKPHIDPSENLNLQLPYALQTPYLSGLCFSSLV